MAEHEGTTYTVGSGAEWDAAERIYRYQVTNEIENLPEAYQEEAEEWLEGRNNLFRVKIHQTLPDGNRKKCHFRRKMAYF